jgi:RNA polymerase sigma-70 factor (ECF subfamily)
MPMMGATRVLDWMLAAPRAAEIDWDDVYRAELPRVLNFFRYRVGQRATAEDLTSTTFEKAWRARRRYRRDRAAVGTWLLAIARNVAIDHFRARRVELPLEDATGVVQSSLSPEEELQGRADQQRLARLIAGLPERERELLALKYGAGETNRAIARLTGLSESNVGTIVSRTVATLRTQWAGGGRP